MLYIFRLIITVIYSILVCVFGSIYCLFSPRNPKHVATFGHMFGRLAPLFGLKVECRKPADAESYGNAIYIANHQNNYDMVTASNIVQPPTVTVGKKSLLWIPFFGQLYWLTGNLLIDRNNRTKAHGTIAEVVNHFKKRRISIWMFPVSDLPQLSKGKGNKIINIPSAEAARGEDGLAQLYVLPPQSTLTIHVGKRKIKLRPEELQKVTGERGRRGTLMRGLQRIDRVEIDSPRRASSGDSEE